MIEWQWESGKWDGVFWVGCGCVMAHSIMAVEDGCIGTMRHMAVEKEQELFPGVSWNSTGDGHMSQG